MTDPALIERITRSLAFMLRHQPESFDLELDPFGFADIEDVVHALNERLGEPVEEEDVHEAVRSGDRPRYEIQGERIRALYGHSIPVEPGPSSKPPEFLYVAVPEQELERARRFGLRGGRRRFLHLALTQDDASESGRRVARDYTVLVIHALDAWEEGISFYDRTALWLAEEVPTHLIDVEGTYHDGTDPMPRRFEGARERGGQGHERGREPGGRGRGRGRDRDRDRQGDRRVPMDRPAVRDDRPGRRDERPAPPQSRAEPYREPLGEVEPPRRPEPSAREAEPRFSERPPERRDTRRDEPRRDEARRDEPRRDEPRRDEPRRDEPRRDEARRDEPRRDRPNRPEPRDERGRGGERSQPPREGRETREPVREGRERSDSRTPREAERGRPERVREEVREEQLPEPSERPPELAPQRASGSDSGGGFGVGVEPKEERRERVERAAPPPAPSAPPARPSRPSADSGPAFGAGL
ncbi:MAG: hypothetical protein EXS08_15165 [Planctomycetes bacterium]|nr:hypothetical protein [Planctomycetota bacterium]